jgi:hypothetical protein
LGHALVAQASVSLGGRNVETLDSRLLEVMDEYNTPLEKVLDVNKMIGRVQNGFTETSLGHSSVPTPVIVPLPFWFSRGDLGAALPIDSLHVDEVRVSIQFRPLNSLYYTESHIVTNSTTSAEGISLWPIQNSSFYANDLSGNVIPGISNNSLSKSSSISSYLILSYGVKLIFVILIVPLLIIPLFVLFVTLFVILFVVLFIVLFVFVMQDVFRFVEQHSNKCLLSPLYEL